MQITTSDKEPKRNFSHLPMIQGSIRPSVLRRPSHGTVGTSRKGKYKNVVLSTQVMGDYLELRLPQKPSHWPQIFGPTHTRLRPAYCTPPPYIMHHSPSPLEDASLSLQQPVAGAVAEPG